MARKVTTEDIRQMNEIYYQCKSYAETARQTGWSASTVRNYIDKNFSPVLEDNIHRFDPDTEMPEFSTIMFEGVENLGDLCVLTDEEKIEIVALWEEIVI
jgi:hypothetical protein